MAVGVGGKVLVGVAVEDGVEVNVGLSVEEAVGTAAALSATTKPIPTCMATTNNSIGTTNQKRKRVRMIAFTTLALLNLVKIDQIARGGQFFDGQFGLV